MSSSWVKTISLLALVASISAGPLPKPEHGFFFALRNDSSSGGGGVAPAYAEYKKVWEEAFDGSPGQIVDESTWNIITEINVNNELQKYTRSPENLQLSGGGTLQIIPRLKDGQWTSGRIESKYVFTPQAGRRTMAEARLRFGDSTQAGKKGYWPAFWLLGDSMRHGIAWPACGEIDVMERINGESTAFGTLHCDIYGGGACNTPTGITQRVPLANNDWHNWRIVWDRTKDNWMEQSMTWFLDGNQFHQITGARLNSEASWKAVAQSPVYFILNLAVGGTLVRFLPPSSLPRCCACH